MKLRDLSGLIEAIERILSNSKNIIFNYHLIKYKVAMKVELENIKTVTQPSPRLIEYETKRITICEKYANKDDAGKPITKDGKYIGLENNPDFQKELQEHMSKYTDVITEYNQQQKEIAELLNKEISFNLPKIPLSIIPNNEISGSDLEIIFPLIEE